MKRKLAFLVSAVMALSLLPMNVSAKNKDAWGPSSIYDQGVGEEAIGVGAMESIGPGSMSSVKPDKSEVEPAGINKDCWRRNCRICLRVCLSCIRNTFSITSQRNN